MRTTETDDLNLQAAALVALADVLIAAGNHADARATAEAALELLGRKGNVLAAKRTRALIGELDHSVDEFAPRSSSNQ